MYHAIVVTLKLYSTFFTLNQSPQNKKNGIEGETQSRTPRAIAAEPLERSALISPCGK